MPMIQDNTPAYWRNWRDRYSRPGMDPKKLPHNEETTYKDYKDFDGIKKATKAESKRDGQDFVKSEVTEFKVLDKVDSKTFSEPE